MSETPNERDAGSNSSAFNQELDSRPPDEEENPAQNFALAPESVQEIQALLGSFRIWLTETERKSQKRSPANAGFIHEGDDLPKPPVDSNPAPD